MGVWLGMTGQPYGRDWALADGKWDDIFSAASTAKQPLATPGETPSHDPKQGPWEGLQAPEKKPTVRFSVDIDLDLSDRLSAKARELRKPKTELVRMLLEWALAEE